MILVKADKKKNGEKIITVDGQTILQGDILASNGTVRREKGYIKEYGD
jgi:hypothetical protein